MNRTFTHDEGSAGNADEGSAGNAGEGVSEDSTERLFTF
jgi:hypothetical protein